MRKQPITTGKTGSHLERVLCALAAGLLLATTGVLAHPPPADRPAKYAVPAAGKNIRGLQQAQVRPDGALVVQKRLSGHGRVHADHVVIDGELSPGNSPGCIDFGGDVTFNFTAVLVIEIGGTTVCTEYDRISVANTLTLSNPTLDVVIINSFPPQYGDRFVVLDWGVLVGTFGAIDTSAAVLSYPLVWDTSQLYLSGELVVDVLHIADGDLAPWDNPDGQINAADVLIATQLVLGQRTPGPLQYAHGDMNLDDVIDLADLLLIQQAVLQ